MEPAQQLCWLKIHKKVSRPDMWLMLIFFFNMYKSSVSRPYIIYIALLVMF